MLSRIFFSRLIKKVIFPILPPEKPKQQSSVNFDPQKFSTYYSLFKTDSKIATQDDKQQDSSDDEENEVEIK